LEREAYEWVLIYRGLRLRWVLILSAVEEGCSWSRSKLCALCSVTSYGFIE
jgi:uncharacterized Fe-S cluster-containing MiaB family protein